MPRSDNPWQALRQSLLDVWEDLRTRSWQELRQLVPFLKRDDPPAIERLAKLVLGQTKEENGFFGHAAAFAAGALFFVVANLLTTAFKAEEGLPGRVWSVMAVGGWFLAVAIHGVDALVTKRHKMERARRKIEEELLRTPTVRVETSAEVPDLRQRLIATAEEARSSFRSAGADGSVVSRGEVRALSVLAWVEAAQRHIQAASAARVKRREAAAGVSDPDRHSAHATLTALLGDLDRREQLLGALSREVDDRRERLQSFLLALESARLARPESLASVSAPLGERVALLEEVTATSREEAARHEAAPSRTDRIEQELRLARDLQRSLLPSEAPPLHGLTVAQVYRPTSELGGDFYDFYADEGKLLICLADASGHGLDSAMVSSMAKSALYLQVAARRSLSEALSECNRMMCDTLGRRRLMTMCLLSIDPDRGTLTWVNAGQVFPIVLRRGSLHELELPGYPLGVRKSVTYAERVERLDPGDVLLLMTDGLPEAPDSSGDAYGWERLSACLRGLSPREPHEVIDALAADLSRHLGSLPPSDDVTMVAVRYAP